MATLVPYTHIPTSVFPFANNWLNMVNDLMSTPEADGIAPACLQMDVEETPESYVVSLTVPGVARDQIDVELNQSRLNITVDKKDEASVAEKNYLRRETGEYHATRSVYLKDAAKEGVAATLKDGVLTITVPKHREDQDIQKIQIG